MGSWIWEWEEGRGSEVGRGGVAEVGGGEGTGRWRRWVAARGWVEEVEDDGKTMALAKGGVTDLARTAGRISLVREVGRTHLARGDGEISLARIAHKVMRASLLCHYNQGGTKTITRTRGLEASRSRTQSLASWAVLRPQSLSTSSNSSLARGTQCSPSSRPRA